MTCPNVARRIMIVFIDVLEGGHMYVVRLRSVGMQVSLYVRNTSAHVHYFIRVCIYVCM